MTFPPVTFPPVPGPVLATWLAHVCPFAVLLPRRGAPQNRRSVAPLTLRRLYITYSNLRILQGLRHCQSPSPTLTLRKLYINFTGKGRRRRLM